MANSRRSMLGGFFVTNNDTTRKQANQLSKPGFWIRLVAFIFDVIFIYWFVRCVEWGLRSAGFYIPRELSFCLVFAAYSVVLITANGHTVGKAACGLAVKSVGSVGISLKQTMQREILCKPLSGLCLGIGFLWVGLSRRKCAWHDRITKTSVVRTSLPRRWPQYVMLAVCIIAAISAGRKALWAMHVYGDIRAVAVSSNARPPYLERDSLSLRDVSSLTSNDKSQLKDWLDSHGLEPVDYMVQTSADHQVTIVGEVHGKKEYLDLLNAAIPRLYHEAGVRCIALEVCLARDNELLNRLVTNPQFDRELAIEIARHMNWRMWGRKEYWDVFETVWRVNQTIPEGKTPLRVIGLSPPVDMPSVMLVAGAGDGKVKPPLWERLRIFRVLDDLIVELKRDELMARVIEREIIEKNARAVVWVGLNHAFTSYKQPIIREGSIFRAWGRMGWILHQRNGDQVFEISLHDNFFLSGIGGFFETLVYEGDIDPVGFSLIDSPFADLRDGRVEEYAVQPGLRFADKAQGYLFIKPNRELRECTWLRGYVSKDMFVRNKPFYRAWAKAIGRNITNAQQADVALETVMNSR